MRILVVGLGSMGKRRIRLMKAFFPEHDIAAAEGSAARREEAKELFGIPTYERAEDAIADFEPEAGFVCTPPLSHSGIITLLLNANMHVFSEINLVSDGYDANEALAAARGKLLFLSSTQMYRREIEYITSEAKSEGRAAYRYHVGQYLPDWHPWESYTDFFVGDARTSGCREIFAIELPWILNAFGPVGEVKVISERLTSLHIDFPDCYFVQLRHQNGSVGQLAVDVVSRKPVREFLMYNEELFLRWRGTPESLTQFDRAIKAEEKISCYDDVKRDERYADNIVENAYVDEMAEFFAAALRLARPRHSFKRDRAVLELIDRIERGAK